MPTAMQQTVQAYAHCQDAQCLGYRQEIVEGVRTTTEFTYLDSGGDMPGVEKSNERVTFVNDEDIPCPHCEKPRAIGEQQRPEYPNISGHDPMGLFEFKGRTEGEIRDIRHAAEVDKLTRDSEAAELKTQLATTQAQLAAMQAQLAELTAAPRGKPGPKPKAAGTDG